MFHKLFEPIKINSVTARNRIVYPALALMYSYDNSINERYINYFQEKAKGGAGIVTVDPVLFCKTGAGGKARTDRQCCSSGVSCSYEY